MTTNGCLNLDGSNYLLFEAGAQWTGAEQENPPDVDLDGVTFPDSFMVGGRDIDLSATFEAEGDSYSFKMANDDEGDWSMADLMAMCGWLSDQCADLIAADEETGEAAVCAWTLMQEQNGGDFSCLISYQYESNVDGGFTSVDCSEIDDEEDDEGRDDEDNQDADRRRADQYMACEASYYRGLVVGQAMFDSCADRQSSCAESVTVPMSGETMLHEIASGAELTLDMAGSGSGAGYSGVYQMYSIEACDTCELNSESDNGYDRMIMDDSNAGATIIPIQAGYMCLIPYMAEGDNMGLQCDNRQVISLAPCNVQVVLKITMESAADPGAVLEVIMTILKNNDMEADVVIQNEDIMDLLPSLSADDEEEVEDRRRSDGQTELAYAFGGVSDTTALKNLFNQDDLNDALGEAGLPEAEWVYTVEEESEGGLSGDSILMNNLFITVLAIGFLIASVGLFSAVRMCSGGGNKKKKDGNDQKALMGDAQPNQYGA